ncbi:hypothetical protein [Acinetobacter seifertii]|uniref:hypothetical protein n=1 Tax=Acinetobacter seifertii TaxID=1530123 RepID=UPI001903049E|nr:hypothetical protein [Acinetobacter seifertii]MBJ9424121.1 hypothetical protein [Acinetobacter seifertii]
MHYKELYKYEHLINSACTKLIVGEIFGIIFLIFCMFILAPTPFESDKWAIDLFGVSISLYYLYPIISSICGLVYLFRNFFKYYRYTIFRFYFKKDFLILKICGIKTVKFNNFNIITDQYRIGHWNGFKKEYFNCIGIANDKKVYLIPVADGKQDELIEVLMNQVDKQVKA